MYRLEIFKIA